MLKSTSTQFVHTLALGALLMSIPSSMLSIPDILNPELKTIYEALKARNPKFNKQLGDALDKSDRDLCEGRHAIGSPEQKVLAWRPTRTIGAAAQAIKNSCNEDRACIENELNGELGEFIELMLNPKGLREENSTTNQRFHVLYNKYAEMLDLVTITSLYTLQTTISDSPAPAQSQSEETSVPAPVKMSVMWQAGKEFLREDNLSDERLATFMRIIAANVNNQPDEQLRADWNKHIENAQKDAKALYDTYCPYTITRRLSTIAAWGTLGLSRFFSPSAAKCDACDTLKEIVDGNVYKEAENKVSMLVKGDASAFNRSSIKSASQQVAEATKLPMEAMLNPATLAAKVIN